MREHKSENKVQRIKDWLRRRVKEEDAVPEVQLQEVSPAVQCQLDHHLSHFKTLPTLRLPASRCLWSPWSSSTPPSLSALSLPSPPEGRCFLIWFEWKYFQGLHGQCLSTLEPSAAGSVWAQICLKVAISESLAVAKRNFFPFWKATKFFYSGDPIPRYAGLTLTDLWRSNWTSKNTFLIPMPIESF